MMRARCTSTVRGLMPSVRPASLLEAPAMICVQHLALARGEQLGALDLQIMLAVAVGRPARPGDDRLAHARDHRGGLDRLLDEVQRAALDGIDGGRHVALSGHDQDRRRIVRRVELAQHVEPERPGMLTSSRMQAGVRARAAARNDWPSAKQVTRQPSGANTADSVSRIVSSSSTTKISVPFELLFGHAPFAPIRHP